MENPESFLEKNKGFVLKLRLVGVGGKFIEFNMIDHESEKIARRHVESRRKCTAK
jgi:hypothetical protein